MFFAIYVYKSLRYPNMKNKIVIKSPMIYLCIVHFQERWIKAWMLSFAIHNTLSANDLDSVIRCRVANICRVLANPSQKELMREMGGKFIIKYILFYSSHCNKSQRQLVKLFCSCRFMYC